jgi:signal transduction histidine kinase/CheY-like chemotaxis protein
VRLADFILANLEPILVDWESFARSIWPKGAHADPAELRDEAGDILRATAADMQSEQTALQQADKSKGRAEGDGSLLTQTSASHGRGRVVSGLELWSVVAEYRALRASVLRLWRESDPVADLHDLDDITRFNESIDQSLSHAVRSYAEEVERDREALMAAEQAARKAAEAANQAKDLFLATLSHEMRTPLNAIVGWLNILRHEDAATKHFAEGLEVIERNTIAQAQLIDDLLDVSRIVSGKLRVDIQPCELADVVNAGLNATRTAADARGISLDVRLDPAAGAASCDRVRIQQVVWNLVSNAIKFTPKGGRVHVTLSREASSFQIQVTDTGQGISAELLPHVFDRFRQADSSMRRRFAGLGLGLSIVKYIVEAHGGTVDATSPGEGKGSTFTVRLPVRAIRMQEESEEAETEGRRGEAEAADSAYIYVPRPPVRLDGVHVLVVDDDADAREVLMRLLERVGAVVVTADSAPAAVAALANARPDVLISDLGMPDQDGFDLIRQLRDDGHDAQDLPAVALTAFVQKDDAHLALSAGVSGPPAEARRSARPHIGHRQTGGAHRLNGIDLLWPAVVPRKSPPLGLDVRLQGKRIFIGASSAVDTPHLAGCEIARSEQGAILEPGIACIRKSLSSTDAPIALNRWIVVRQFLYDPYVVALLAEHFDIDSRRVALSRGDAHRLHNVRHAMRTWHIGWLVIRRRLRRRRHMRPYPNSPECSTAD